MADRVTDTTVTFRRPFALSALGAPQPAGTYRVTVDEAEILGLSFLAYQRMATTLHMPAVSVTRGPQQSFAVDPAELEAALAADARD